MQSGCHGLADVTAHEPGEFLLAFGEPQRQFHPGSRLLLDQEIFLNPDELGVTATHLLAGLE
jgi:hypothetical protein